MQVCLNHKTAGEKNQFVNIVLYNRDHSTYSSQDPNGEPVNVDTCI